MYFKIKRGMRVEAQISTNLKVIGLVDIYSPRKIWVKTERLNGKFCKRNSMCIGRHSLTKIFLT